MPPTGPCEKVVEIRKLRRRAREKEWPFLYMYRGRGLSSLFVKESRRRRVSGGGLPVGGKDGPYGVGLFCVHLRVGTLEGAP